MRLFFPVLLVLLLLLHVACSSPLPRFRLANTSIRAFTPNEFYASYELMVQYKHANVSSCPTVWKYSGVPIDEHSMLFLAHGDMSISAPNDTVLYQCNYAGALHLLRSTFLTGSTLDAFENDIADDVDKFTVYNSLRAQLDGAIYYVSAGTSPPTCGGLKYFDSDEMFVFFDESETVMLSVVAKVQHGAPRVLTLPLVGNIRYMLTVRSGTTCIYRVESDVQHLVQNNPRPSDSPSPLPMRVSPSPTPYPEIPPQTIVEPAVIALASPTLLSSPISSASPISTVMTSPSVSPTPTRLQSTAVESAMVTPTVSASPFASAPPPSVVPLASPSRLPSPSPSSRPSMLGSPSPSLSSYPSASPPSPSPTPSKYVSAIALPSKAASVGVSASASPIASVKMLKPPQQPSQQPSPSSTTHATPSMTPLPPLFFPDASDEPISPVVSEPPAPTGEEVLATIWPSTEATEEPEVSRMPVHGHGPWDWLRGSAMCFSGSASVRLSDGRRREMWELGVGDKVEVGNGVYSRIMMFTHRKRHVQASFVRVGTENGTSLMASAGHFVYVGGRLVRMGDVSVGDVVQVVAGGGKGWQEEVVKWRRVEDGVGLYNPQTESGEIVVDGVRASCYTEAVKPATAQALLLAVRGLGLSTAQ